MTVRKWLGLLSGFLISLSFGVASPAQAEGRDLYQFRDYTYRADFGCGIGWGTVTETAVYWWDPHNPETTWSSHTNSRFVNDAGYEWVGHGSTTFKNWGIEVPEDGTFTAMLNGQSSLTPVGKNANTRRRLWFSEVQHLTVVDGEVKADPSRVVMVDRCE